MFSGLIAHGGVVASLDALPEGGARLRVRADGVPHESVEPKDSIAVNGVCLTATSVAGDVIAFDVIPETLQRSTLGGLRPGDAVNLEYSLRLGDRMGGHFVYGHVDATATVLARETEGQGVRLRLERPASIARMLPEKAFVAVDGVSVTIAAAGDGWFEVALIPETLDRTTLGKRFVHDRVNVEADPIARYAVGALREI